MNKPTNGHVQWLYNFADLMRAEIDNTVDWKYTYNLDPNEMYHLVDSIREVKEQLTQFERNAVELSRLRHMERKVKHGCLDMTCTECGEWKHERV